MADRTRNVLNALVASALFASSLLAPGAAAPAHARPRAKLAPATGALFGAYVDRDNAWRGNDAYKGEVLTFERQLGRKVSVNQHYYGWTQSFPSGLEEWDLANGRIPLISWSGTRLTDILNKKHDQMILARAVALRRLGKPVFLRWGWEMNGNWYAWDGAHNGGSAGPARYIAAWRRIHRLFAARGATNVVWVWSPNHASVPNQAWNHWRKYYPGDAYVDWVGIDGYNWGGRSWKTFASLFAPVYRDYAARKPIMIAETASHDAGGDKRMWIAQMRSAIKNQFPSVAAVLWFHVPKERNWHADSTRTSLGALRTLGADTYYKPVVNGVRRT